MCARDERVRRQESRFFKQGISSSFNFGSGISNEGSKLRVNGSLEVGMFLGSSLAQRLDSYSVERIKVG